MARQNGEDEDMMDGRKTKQRNPSVDFSGCWTTERSREVAELYERYHSIAHVAAELEMSTVPVTMNCSAGLGEDKHRARCNSIACGAWRCRLPNTSETVLLEQRRLPAMAELLNSRL